MKFLPLASVILMTMVLIACGDPKPGQYPPSLYDEQREGLLSDRELLATKKKYQARKLPNWQRKFIPLMILQYRMPNQMESVRKRWQRKLILLMIPQIHMQRKVISL